MFVAVCLGQPQQEQVKKIRKENKMDIKEKLKEFDSKHGDFVVYEGWLLFEDGAYREKNPMGRWAEPDTDIYKRNKRIAHYYEIKLQLAVEEFWRLKNNLHAVARFNTQQQQNVNCPPDKGQLDHLKELKRKVNALKKRFEEATKQVEASRPKEMKIREKIEEENRLKNEQFLNELNEIEV